MPPPSIGLLAVSKIPSDPRVRRQGDAFADAGWRVFAVGMPSGDGPPTRWPVLTPDHVPVMAGAAAPPGFLSRIGTALQLVGARASTAAADALYWQMGGIGDQLFRVAHHETADIWVANDWSTLPLAARLARVNGGVYTYDSHELAVEEFAERRLWRLLRRPYVAALEARHISGAQHVSAVSRPIAERLQSLYDLPGTPLVVRNLPAYRETPFRPTGMPIRVLYHGVISPNRGLEEAIASVRDWRAGITLTIRGPGSDAYIAELKSVAAVIGVTERFSVLPPVATTELVAEAAAYDIGLHPLPDLSANNRYALPNKVFEYAMAGLALCVSDLPEMARLVSEHGIGRTFPTTSLTQGIAAAVNAFEPSEIDTFKRASLEAAKVLCWEQESARMVDAYRSLL